MSKRKSSCKSIIRVGVADKSPLVQAALTHLFAQDERLRAHSNAPRIIVYTGADGNSVPAQVMEHGGAALTL